MKEADESTIWTLKNIMDKAEEWRRKREAQFKKFWYMLVHFSKSRSSHDEATLEIEGTTITPTETAWYELRDTSGIAPEHLFIYIK